MGTICFLSSLMILHVQTKLAAPPGSTTASLTPLAQVARARMPGQVVRARIALEPAQDPQDFELSHEKEDSSLDKNVPVACAISMPKPKADDDLVDHTFAELLRQGILAEKDLDVRKRWSSTRGRWRRGPPTGERSCSCAKLSATW